MVTAPDGSAWRVRRRWLERPMPNLERSFKANRRQGLEDGVLDGLTFADVGESGAGFALAIGVVLVIFIVLPLLGVALELVAVLFLLAIGVFGRVVLGRPWIVLAEKAGDPEERVAFAVRGWRESSEALRELRTALSTQGPPERIAHGEPLATKPAF
jgi:hypothetical protein